MPSTQRRAAAAVLLVTALLGVSPPPSSASGAVGSVAPVHPAVRVDAPASTTGVWSYRTLLAGGVRQWIACAGKGPVTIVVIAGLHADHRMWRLVLGPFARTTRTCIYDRPGLGASPGRSPHTTVSAGGHARELGALLAAAHVTGPLAVVGHSYGGLVARAFVARYPHRVAGLVLVEGVAPYDRLRHYWSEGGDRVDTWASSAAARLIRLGSVPLVVLSAQDPDRSYWGGPAYGASASDIADWKAHQRAAASLSTHSTFVIVRHSAHVIEHDRPDAVIAGVQLLVHAIETRTALPRCSLGAYGVQPLCP
jgi:pimeloyl-ACP methyl ester carboxylesterase